MTIGELILELQEIARVAGDRLIVEVDVRSVARSRYMENGRCEADTVEYAGGSFVTIEAT